MAAADNALGSHRGRQIATAAAQRPAIAARLPPATSTTRATPSGSGGSSASTSPSKAIRTLATVPQVRKSPLGLAAPTLIRRCTLAAIATASGSRTGRM